MTRQNSVRELGFAPAPSSGIRSMPSSFASAGTAAPAAARIVARQIHRDADLRRDTRPAGMRPGQRMIAGTRMPPS